MNRKKQYTGNVLTKLRITASLHMSTRTEQLHKWIADGASQVSHYWSGKFKINRQDGYSDLCSNNFKLQTSIKAHAIFNIGITAVPMDRCKTVSKHKHISLLCQPRSQLRGQILVSKLILQPKNQGSQLADFRIKIEIRKMNTEYSVMPERRNFFYFFLQ